MDNTNDGRVGCVDSFDGVSIGGWASSERADVYPPEISFLVDGTLVGATATDQPRDDLTAFYPGHRNKGFRFVLPTPLGDGPPFDLHRLPQISALYTDTSRLLDVTPGLSAIVNRPQDAPRRFLETYATSRLLPVPPERFITHIGGASATAKDFNAIGADLALDIYQLGLLARGDLNVVDLGCGCGRIAMALAPFLATGTYLGVDTWAPGIRWATENITSKYPNVTFGRLGKRGKGGYLGQEAFSLTEVADGSCDLVLAISLFTHLTSEAAVAYLKEIRRVLKPLGVAYLTFFICNDEVGEWLADLEVTADGRFSYEGDIVHSYFFDWKIREMLAESRLGPVLKRYGYWRGEQHAQQEPRGYQDLFIVRPNP